jgi:hypothetical protein
LHAFGEDLDVEFPVLDILEVTCMAAKSMCRNQIRKVEETPVLYILGSDVLRVFLNAQNNPCHNVWCFHRHGRAQDQGFFVLENLGFLPLTQMGATLVQSSGIKSWCGAL